MSHALYALIPVEQKLCPTMAVDKHGRMYFNPTFSTKLSVDAAATVVLHEVSHRLRRHHERAEAMGITAATAKIAGIAMDLELNDDIADEVSKYGDIAPLPPGAFYPSALGFEDGCSWEEYYGRMLDQAEQGGGGGGGGSSGDDTHGSGAHGVARPWEQPGPSQGGGEGIEDADWQDIERRVAEAIQEEVRKGRGNVAAGWVDWANDILRVERIPWDHELAGAVRWAVNDVAGKVIHNYRRPSRRQQACPDVVFPSMRRRIPGVAFVGDTSASMSGHALSLVRGVVQDVCNALGAALSFIATDAAAYGVQKTTDGRSIEMRGRGGTDMRVGIAAALDEVRPRPDVIVVASDCDTPWPDEEPPVRVIVCAIEASDDAIAAIPSWAKTIIVNEASS
jgi:predicted metal-dependent peptidase